MPSPPPPLVRSPPEGERRSGKPSCELDYPTALRLGLSRGRGGPARGGVGETIGKAGKGDESGTREAGPTNLFQIFLSSLKPCFRRNPVIKEEKRDFWFF